MARDIDRDVEETLKAAVTREMEQDSSGVFSRSEVMRRLCNRVRLNGARDADKVARMHRSGQVSRRQFLKMLGLGTGVGIAAVGGVGYFFGTKIFDERKDPLTGFQAASLSEGAINLGEEGLSQGDNIDPYINEHWTSGSEVYIPSGSYTTEMDWWDTSVTDATLVGDREGVELQRPDDFVFDGRISFDGHCVVENMTFSGQLGSGRHRPRLNGQSGDALMEIRNINDPIGSVGCSDAIFMRGEGSGTIYWRWCYLSQYPNSTFYALDNQPRLVFDGCVFRNTTNVHRGGSDEYTVINCLYISDGDAPDFCEVDNSDCSCNDWGGLQRFFKFDQSYEWSGGHFENIHYWAEDVPSNGPWMDFQSESAGTGGTMDGLYLYNAAGKSNMFRFSGDHDWEVRNVHLTGPTDTDVPGFFQTVSNPEQPVSPDEIQVWTPGGDGLPDRLGGTGAAAPPGLVGFGGDTVGGGGEGSSTGPC